MGNAFKPLIDGVKRGARSGIREGMVSIALPFAAVWRLLSTTAQELQARFPVVDATGNEHRKRDVRHTH